MTARLIDHVHRQYAGFLALAVALSGTAYAATALPRNSVTTKQVKNDTGEKGDTGATGPVGPSTGAAGGDLAGSFPNPVIAFDAVNGQKILDGSILSSDIQNHASDNNQRAISSSHIQNEAITSEKLAAGAVTADKVARAAHAQIFDEATAVADNTPVTLDVAARSGTTSSGLTFNSSPSRVTAGATGLYLVSGYVKWPTAATGGTYRQLVVSRAGGGPSGGLSFVDILSGPTGGLIQPFSAAISLAAGESVVFIAAQDTGGTINAELNAAMVQISG
jgi:hypothetical protein